MSTKFYPLRVKQIERTTADCAVISLDIPAKWKPGFLFHQGQHLTLKAVLGGEEVRRSYSLCTSPLEDEWKVAVKKVPQGRFSTFANEVLREGDILEVMPPNGRFFIEPEPEKQKNYVAFAAGSGITPVLSILKTHLQLEPLSSFQLFYVNQSTASIMLREEVEALKNKYLDRFEIFHLLTREERNIPLFNGRITAQKLDVIFKLLIDKETVDHYFLCGPAEMIFLIRDYLTRTGINSNQIHFELFNTAEINKNRRRVRSEKANDGSTTAVKIIEGGKSFTFELPRGGATSILDAALKQKADLPFACKGGVCCTCKAKLLEGAVEMEVNYALEQEQLDAGYILTCQAIPVSDQIVVDYDG